MNEQEREHIQRIDAIVLELVKRKELRKLWNGVGSERPILNAFKPPLWVCNLFAEASQFHDVGYWVGGTEWHREAVDQEFERRCFDAMLDLGFWQRLRAKFWVGLCGDLVRNFGALAFTLRPMGPEYNIDALLAEVENGR